MRVLVAVNMRNPNPGTLQLSNLGCGLRRDLLRTNAEGDEIAYEARQALSEGAAVRAKRGNLGWR
jgi:hypothetical protein